jgi:hypothetical protein
MLLARLAACRHLLPEQVAQLSGMPIDHGYRLLASRGGRACFDWLHSLPADVLERFRLDSDIEAEESAEAATPEKAGRTPQFNLERRETAEEALRALGYIAERPKKQSK